MTAKRLIAIDSIPWEVLSAKVFTHFEPWERAIYRTVSKKWKRLIDKIPPIKSAEKTSLCNWAALNGHLKILQWARDRKIHGDDVCSWNSSTCANAAKNGHLKILQWARDRKIHGDDICPWDSGTCANAAKGGPPQNITMGARQKNSRR
jgi:hypothetical protein